MKTKAEVVESINKLYTDNKCVVVIDYKGMNAEDTVLFRGALRQKCGVGFFVVKNTLNKLSAKGTVFEDKISFKGQCGVIFCNDLLKVSKVVDEFCFSNEKAKFVACFEGEKVCSAEQLKELASLPSIEVLRTKLLYVLNSVGSSLARALSERVKKEGGVTDKTE